MHDRSLCAKANKMYCWAYSILTLIFTFRPCHFLKIQYFTNFKVWAGSVVRFLLCEPQVMYHVCLDLYSNWWWYLCSGVGIASLPHFRPVLYDACCTLSLAANMRFLQLTSLVPNFLASFSVAKCKRKSSKEPGNKALLHPAYTDKIPETPREHPKTAHVWACSFFYLAGDDRIQHW